MDADPHYSRAGRPKHSLRRWGGEPTGGGPPLPADRERIRKPQTVRHTNVKPEGGEPSGGLWGSAKVGKPGRVFRMR